MLKKFVCNERGTETVEWGVMAGLIVAGAVAAVAAIGVWVSTKLDGLKTAIGA